MSGTTLDEQRGPVTAAPTPPAPTPLGERLALALWGLVAVGLLLRPLLAWFSIGTNDAVSWFEYHQAIGERGLFQFYRDQPLMNHPPLAGLWAVLAGKLAGPTPTLWAFSFAFKLPMMLADTGACWVLYRIFLRRQGELAGILVAMAYAWNPTAILVGAHHCNTDNLLAFACLWAFYLLHDDRRFFWGGLVLAGAINVKIVPVLLIPAALALCRRPRQAGSLLGGLAAGAIPYLPALLMVGPAFLKNVLGYNSLVSRWGLSYWLLELSETPAYASFGQFWLDWLSANGRYLIVALILGLALLEWRRRWHDGYVLAAGSLAIFLVFAGGFGVQYLVWPAPLLLAANWRLGLLYGWLAGLSLGTMYYALWQGTVPAQTIFFYSLKAMQQPGPFLGLLAWWTLLCFLARLVWQRPVPGAPAAPPV